MPLREALADYLASKGILTAADALLITSGSQGVLDGIGKDSDHTRRPGGR